MSSDIDGIRRAFVTGASTGIGAAIAAALGHEGYELVLAGRDAHGLQDVKERIEAKGGRVYTVPMDLSDPRRIGNAIEAVWTEFGPCNTLINCGGCSCGEPAVDVTVDDWDEVININLRGSYLTAVEFARRLIAGKRTGSIVNIGSKLDGPVGSFLTSPSMESPKAGLHHMTRMLAIEWAEHGIQVNAIAPGATETPSRAGVFRDPATRKRLLDRIPTHQFTTTDEVAAAALYLVSPHARVVTGHILVLDGGLTVY